MSMASVLVPLANGPVTGQVISNSRKVWVFASVTVCTVFTSAPGSFYQLKFKTTLNPTPINQKPRLKIRGPGQRIQVFIQ